MRSEVTQWKVNVRWSCVYNCGKQAGRCFFCLKVKGPHLSFSVAPYVWQLIEWAYTDRAGEFDAFWRASDMKVHQISLASEASF